MNSSIYSCNVYHRRYSPNEYSFTSRLFMFMLDLDELDAVVRQLPMLSRNRPNVYSFRDDDHLCCGESGIRANVEKFLHGNGISEHPQSIRLLTNLRTFGYVFNPVSFFFCCDATGDPLAVIVEVHNTFGELKPFLLSKQHLQDQGFRGEFDKLFYISPFSELDNRLQLKVMLPGDRLHITVNSQRPDESMPFFRSSLSGKRVTLSTANLLAYSARFPFVTLKIIGLIHYHALRLYLRRNPFLRKSARPDLQTGILPKKKSFSSVTTS